MTDRAAEAVPTYDVCGVPVAALTPDQAARLIVERAETRSGFQAHLCNAYTLSLVESDQSLKAALLQSDLNLPDGTPVAWLGRLHGTKGPVRGPALVGDVARAGVSSGLRHFLYGGAPGVAESMAAALQAHAPGIEVVGIESPPFRNLTGAELDDVTKRITETQAHIVWVGLGTPRQDHAVPVLSERINAVVIPVGAAFDFWAGNVKPAPATLHGSGLEWVYRLFREPRRLWRRYLFGNPRFLTLVVRHRMRPRRELE